jgi:hypothetical protein
MSITVAKLAANSASVKLMVGEDDLNVIYAPALVTEKAFTIIPAIQAAKDDTAAMAAFVELDKMLVLLIKSWDFYEDVEETMVVALTEERMASVPIVLRVQLLEAIKSDFRPQRIAA